MPTAVIAHRASDGFRYGAKIRDDFLRRLVGQLRCGFQRLVQVRHVRVVVLAMVNLHGLGINVRLEGIRGVRKRR